MRTTVFLTVTLIVTFVNSLPYRFLTTLYKTKLIKLINSGLEKECTSDLIALVSDASDFKLWALKMLDSSGKIDSGLLNGNFHLMGEYDQCLSIKEEISDRTVGGQYCTALISTDEKGLNEINLTSIVKKIYTLPEKMDTIGLYNEALALRLGLCLPKSCSVRDLQNIAQNIAHEFSQYLEVNIEEQSCYYKDKPLVYTKLDFYIYLFFTTIFVTVLVSTIYDVFLRVSGQIPNTFVIFSAYTNLKKLFSGSSKNDTTLTSINGIGAICCIWLVLTHTMATGAVMTKNPIYIFTEWKTQIQSTFIWGSFYTIDSFLTISGLLVCYIYLKYSERMSISLTSFYLFRYVRLTPALLAATLIQISVVKLILGGPYGPLTAQKLTDICCNRWWDVFYSFIVYPKCILQAWYMTVDAQLYFFAPFVIFFIKKTTRSALKVMFLVFVLGIIYNIVVTMDKMVGFTVFEWSNNYKNYIHKCAFAHVPSWLIGILCGYLLYAKKIKISPKINSALWVLSLFTMANLIMNQISFVGTEYSIYRSILWNALARPLWCLCLSFIIWSCGTGNGGSINTFLSNSMFRILGKLTYSIYLVHHFAIMLVFFGLKKNTIYFSTCQILSLHLTIMVISVFCAIPMYLCFEAPLDAMQARMEKHRAKMFI